MNSNPSHRGLFDLFRSFGKARSPEKKARAAKPRSLRVESLEDRQLLSATPYETAIDDSLLGAELVASLSDPYVPEGNGLRLIGGATVNGDSEDVVSAELIKYGQDPDNVDPNFIFNLSGNSASTHTLYLDFWGGTSKIETAAGPRKYGPDGDGVVTTPMYSGVGDTDPNSFSNDELRDIFEIWLRVKEYYAPFDVNVTTKLPAAGELSKDSATDDVFGLRVAIGGSDLTWYHPGETTHKSAGVTFTWSGRGTDNRIESPYTFDCPQDQCVYVFVNGGRDAWSVARTVAHETGHALGLSHDGITNADDAVVNNAYYDGTDDWGPIMGSNGGDKLYQWSMGEYPNACQWYTNDTREPGEDTKKFVDLNGDPEQEDDVAVIATTLGYVSDDHSDWIMGATPVISGGSEVLGQGLIGRTATGGYDVDFFEINSPGSIDITIGGIGAYVTNLDVLATLYDSTGNLIQTFDDTNKLYVKASIPAAGTYYLSVEGTGTVDSWGDIVSTKYGSMGEYSIVLNAIDWVTYDLSDPAAALYDTFQLDTRAGMSAGTVTSVLSGWDDGTSSWVDIWTTGNLKLGGEVDILGQDSVAETLYITANAMTDLGLAAFDGGTTWDDTLYVAGTLGNDEFTVDSTTSIITVPLYPTNPYAGLLARAEKVYGATSPKYLRLEAYYNACYDRLKTLVTTTVVADSGSVELTGGATVLFRGASDVTVNGDDGDDFFVVKSLNLDWTFSGDNGDDTVDFQNVADGITIDLGSTDAQTPIKNDIGTLTLADAFFGLVGSAGDDSIVGAPTGNQIDGFGGNDSVVLTGGDNDLALRDGEQSVVVNGDGINLIALTNADNSIVNCFGVTDLGTVDLVADGDKIAIFGGKGTYIVDIDGDEASVSLLGATKVDAVVLGDLATVKTGAGDDVIGVIGDFATVVTDGGDDDITVFGDLAEVYADGGNDVIDVIGDFATIFGGFGDNVIDATGDYAKIYALTGADKVTVVGDYANVKTDGGNDDVAVTGDYAKIYTDGGDDVVFATGDFAEIKTDGGNDAVTLVGANAKVYLGRGDDSIIVGDLGMGGPVGGNFVDADGGNDIIFAANASGANTFRLGSGNDVAIGSAGDDDIRAEGGYNVMIGLAGADRIQAGCGGRNIMVGSTPDNLVAANAMTPAQIDQLRDDIFANWKDRKSDPDDVLAIIGTTAIADGDQDVLKKDSRRDVVFMDPEDTDRDQRDWWSWWW
ncbi:MAG: hypothetical protein IJM30_08835 [Thermoguttaceae bacterium]|nr:hypothetical protein [Thermoguttaceae bacterium]